MDRKKVRDEDSPDRNIPSENEPSYKKFSRVIYFTTSVVKLIILLISLTESSDT